MIPVFSTAYLPPIAYVVALVRYPEVYIETKETFPKQTYRNRAEIMTADPDGPCRAEQSFPHRRGGHRL